MDQKKPLLVITGPTASGKTGLAIEAAKHYNGEIVSADSMQVYKGMDIGTAKPSLKEKQGIPHHMMDFLDGSQTFSVSDYVSMAKEAITGIHRRGKLPIVAGGTGLYIHSLIDNIQFTTIQNDEKLRQKLYERIETEGGEALLEELRTFDPAAAGVLHPNNKKRIVRAIEIYKLTGTTMTEHQANSRKIPSEYNTCCIGLGFADRQILYDRINKRVDKMMEQGLLQEAKELYEKNALSLTASQAIGYKELFSYFKGEYTLDEAVEKIKQESRRYAKRQLTWFRKDERIYWIYVDKMKTNEKILKEAQLIVEKYLSL